MNEIDTSVGTRKKIETACTVLGSQPVEEIDQKGLKVKKKRRLISAETRDAFTVFPIEKKHSTGGPQ